MFSHRASISKHFCSSDTMMQDGPGLAASRPKRYILKEGRKIFLLSVDFGSFFSPNLTDEKHLDSAPKPSVGQ
jgi:hypothetical protein